MASSLDFRAGPSRGSNGIEDLLVLFVRTSLLLGHGLLGALILDKALRSPSGRLGEEERVDFDDAQSLRLGNTEVDEDGRTDKETGPDEGDLGTDLLLNDRGDESYESARWMNQRSRLIRNCFGTSQFKRCRLRAGKLTDNRVDPPIRRRGQSDTLGSQTLREDLGSNDPSDGPDSRGETSNKDGRECDQGFTSCQKTKNRKVSLHHHD